jgi:ATP-binding cassette subfamily C protein
LNIEAGEFAALVGPSGSGKSSLLRLLLGFDTPESGAIYYDGQDLHGLDLQAVRRQLGVVLQNGKLMPGDIRTNIVGMSALTIEDAWEAVRMAGLDKEIEQMPMGMHTVIGEGGSTLSGGQRQRLLIARAIVTKPRILFFDEATSALDNAAQAVVAASLERLQATRVVIAHRLSTIVKADRIFVLDAGRLVQTGTYAELVNQPGLFADLVKRQLA